LGSILLVNDDPGLCAFLRGPLDTIGYDVIHADRLSALMELEVKVVDLTLIGLRMPGAPGLELCREIRRRSDAPILVVTAQTGSADSVAFLDAGSDGYVTRPVSPPVLVARIQSLLRRHGGELDTRP
jgi:two-component system response regulator RegX3